MTIVPTFPSSRIHVITWIFLAVIISGCTSANNTESTDPTETIQDAFDRKDLQTAAEIMENSRTYALECKDISQLVQFSIFYMRLADANDSEDMVGYAYQCLSRAFEIDSTATAEYINTLSVEDMSQATAVKTLLGASEIQIFHDDSEYPDSLFYQNNILEDTHK